MKLSIRILLLIFFCLSLNISYSFAEERHPLIKIIKREIIEWTTVSRTSPVCEMAGCLVMHYDTLNQKGIKFMVTFAEIKWKGEIKEIELERMEMETKEVPKREIFCR